MSLQKTTHKIKTGRDIISRQVIIALLPTNKRDKADIVVLIWFTPFFVDNSYPEIMTFTICRKVVRTSVKSTKNIIEHLLLSEREVLD